MANQMIALGVKGPQLPDVGGIAMRYGNVMANMAVAREKQNSIQRANAFRQLVSSPDFDPLNADHVKAAAALDPEGASKIAQSFGARRKDDQTYAVDQIKRLRDFGAAVGDEAGYQAWLVEVEKASPAEAAAFRQFSPTFDQDKMNRILMTADQFINKSVPTPQAQLTYDAEGFKSQDVIGGLPGVAGSFPLMEYELDTSKPVKKEVELGEPFNIRDGGMGGPMENTPVGGNDLAGVASVLSNVTNDTEYQAVLNTINSQNPQIATAIRQAMPRFDPQRMAGIRAAGAQAFGGAGAPDLPGLVAGERGGVGGPYAPTGRQARGKSPLQSPAPGTNIQTLPRIAGEAGATESGKQNVRVTTEPVIAGGSEAAKLRAKRNDEYPETTSRMKANLARIDNIIETAKALRNHPAYRRIIGPIDAYTPNITGGARAAQELFKTLSSLGAVDELQKMRQESPTGGSVGNASDADIQLLREGFAALGQGQDEADFDVSLRGLINRAMQTRQRIADQYRDTYGYRLPKNWTAPPVTKTRPQAARKETPVGQFVVMEPE